MNRQLRYFSHVVVTTPVLAIHYLTIPFYKLYKMTDWGLVNYKNFK